MQSSSKIVTNGLMALSLLFGLTVSATAVEQSFDEIKALAEQGNSAYQSYLGTYYANGQGVRQDYAKAFYWNQKSANQGNAFGQYGMGDAYRTGRVVRQDDTKAFYWFQKSADQGNMFAQTTIGMMYANGQGVRQNKTSAKEWFGKSCDNGYQMGCDLYRELNEQGY